MTIEFGNPLSKGFERMKKALFHPFDIGKWFTLGFTAFLAGLTDCNGHGGGNYSSNHHNDWETFFQFPQMARDWMVAHPFFSGLIITGIITVVIISVIFTWLSSRGKFMFLYNVVNNSAEVSKPWHEFKKEGNSLFIWRFIFGLLAFGVLIIFLIYCFETCKEIYFNDIRGVAEAWAIFNMITIFLGYLIIVGYISVLLNDFVVPVMYKHKSGILQGWSKFFTVFRRRPGYFILYGLFLFVLKILVIVILLVACVLTCCIGFLLLLIPYINAVLLLPVSFTFRAFSIEFLGQFGDEFNLFANQGNSLQEA